DAGVPGREVGGEAEAHRRIDDVDGGVGDAGDDERGEGGEADAAAADQGEVLVAELERALAAVGDGDEDGGDEVLELGRETPPGAGDGDDLDAGVDVDGAPREAGD